MRYQDFVARNSGYVSQDLQENIRKTRLLIAGCGMGSALCEAAVRLGFEQFVLVDGDTIETHNLNRQNFVAADVGTYKVEALAKRLRAIRPDVKVEAVKDWVTTENVKDLVSQADIVIDTIDFLSLPAIVAIHDEAGSQKKPIFSCLAVGWGAGIIYFPADTNCGARQLFGLPKSGPLPEGSYVDSFRPMVERFAVHLNPAVMAEMARVFPSMKDAKPCPASQVSGGAYEVAAVATTAIMQYLAGEELRASPEMILTDLTRVCATQSVSLLDKPKKLKRA